MESDINKAVSDLCTGPVIELPRHNRNELHLIVTEGDDILTLSKWAATYGYYLCTMVASDEQLLEDQVFKMYYVFSGWGGDVIILEHSLRRLQYPSISESFPSAIPLEEEAFDLFGLTPSGRRVRGSFLLHSPYPKRLWPLRRRRTVDEIRDRILSKNNSGPLHPIQEDEVPATAARPKPLPEGTLLLPVGPIHAGVIEAGRFTFRLAGEVIEGLSVHLGYKHKGIEKLFETNFTLEDGYRLAERVSGDTSFAHSAAYCQAVESLAGVQIPEEAQLWRALFLELERIYNHIGDVAALVHDIAFDLLASRLSVLREEAARVNAELSGHRLLRGLNVPGGVTKRPFERLSSLRRVVAELSAQFLEFSKVIAHMPACRDRMITTGLLTAEDIKEVGATGMALRASLGTSDLPEDLGPHDFRTRHLQGAFALLEELSKIIRATVSMGGGQPEDIKRNFPVYWKDLRGDVFARMLLRIAEVETSALIIDYVAEQLLVRTWESSATVEVGHLLRASPTYEFGIGYIEGWRGNIIYWVMKGPSNSIFRCKVRDPSLFNWPALAISAVRKKGPTARGAYIENILADFPLINKSFNLSYSGHDL